MATQAHSLSYAGCNFLRQRLVLSTLSGRPVKIRKIRARDDNPGLRGKWGLAARRVRAGGPGETALMSWGLARGEPQGPAGALGRAGGGWWVAPNHERTRGGGEAGSGPRGELRGVSPAVRRAPRLQGAGCKQVHVFQHYVLQQIPGFAPSLVFSPSCSLHTRLKGEKQFVGPKCGDWADFKMEGDLERRVPPVGSVPCPKTGLSGSCPLGQRLSLSP